jgi:hypothetical protein
LDPNLFPVLETLYRRATVVCSFFMYNALEIIAYCDVAGWLAPFAILEAYDTPNVSTI